MVDRLSRSLLELARGVLEELDLEVVLRRVVSSAQELTDARYAALGVLAPSGDHLERFITVGLGDDERQQIGDLPHGHGVLGELIRDPRPLRLPNVSRHPRSWGFPPLHPRMESFLGVPILVGGEPYGNLYLTEKEDALEFTPDDEEALMLLAELAGIAIGHARSYRDTSARRDELERAVSALDASSQIAQALAGETDLEHVLELVAKRGRALVSARALLVELVSGNELELAAAAGEYDESLIGRRFPLADTVASAAIRTLRTQRLDDDLNRSRYEQRGLGSQGMRAEVGLVVPLAFRGRAYGVLLAIDRLNGDPDYSADDQRLLEAFAASAAAAVSTALTFTTGQQRQRLEAAEDERRRWARELHDETLQSLAAVQMALGSASKSVERPELRGTLDQATEWLQQEIVNLRALIVDLRPPALDDFGVEGALRSLADRVARRGVEVQMEIDLAWESGRATARPTQELETAVYRLVQESLTNVVKHGNARRATVTIREDDQTLTVDVSDDGVGFDPGAGGSGFGLVGMRERVDLLSGRLAIDSAPGAGTTVRAVLPVRRRETAEVVVLPAADEGA